jgi:aminomethyltransferase
MPLPGPVHERLAARCRSFEWKDWSGYCAVRRFDHSLEPEYFALREAAGLLDVSPLYKYELRGADAARLLSRMTVRDAGRLAEGRVAYTCWCDDDGRVVDDGTMARLGGDHFRLTAAEPTFGWLHRLARGLDVEVEDSTALLAAFAVQGPASRAVLGACCDGELDSLGFFRVAVNRIAGVDGWVSRTGYTGDLGYEVWVPWARAVAVWDALVEAGGPYGLTPIGLDALDLSRIEAGFLLAGVDYFGARRVVQDFRKSTPYELGLGWMVALDRAPFVGRSALRREKERGAAWGFVGLEASWVEIEALYESYGLPPSLPTAASRDALPVYLGERQVGKATSHAWSPLLKKRIALASIQAPFDEQGTELEIEHTVEFERRRVSVTVVPTPFFDPERKRRP